MSKRIITAETIRLARKNNVQEICVSACDIITPQAKDDAKEFGMVFVVEGASFTSTTATHVQMPSYTQKSTGHTQGNAGRVQGNAGYAQGNAGRVQGNAFYPHNIPTQAHTSQVFSTNVQNFSAQGQDLLLNSPVPARFEVKSHNTYASASSRTIQEKSLHGSNFHVPYLDNKAHNQTYIYAQSKDKTMIFLTEEDVRQRGCPQGATFVVQKGERLTPSAAEYLRQCNAKIVEKEEGFAPSSTTVGGSALQNAIHTVSANGVEAAFAPQVNPVGQTKNVCSADACCPGMTHLDAAHLVAKSHPRIEFRGKLDSVLAAMVMVQTQFDVKERLPEFLRLCLQDTAVWIENVLRAEVSGNALPTHTVGGMSAATMHTISRNPQQYLGIEHIMPSVQHGSNLAFLNWLRALLRETEVLGAKSGIDREDILEALNRLSSAMYVLMLFTVAVEKGLDISKFGAK